ncbi:MAG: hypothetical protein ACI841_000992 [Planctomycetota bacterium]|jgi:hypothetical protein
MTRPKDSYDERSGIAMLSISIAVLLLSSMGLLSKPLAPKKLRIFLLVGQSNMQGKGKVDQLQQLAQAETTRPQYGHWLDKSGDWATRDDVWMWYLDRMGPLTVGYGSPAEDRFGPELEIGRILGDAYDDPVLLIKTAWGGKSLALDFRPPSSGGEVGAYYEQTLESLRSVLATRKELFPEIECSAQQLEGVFWFQGWNDRVNQEFNDEYEVNLANWIRDLRKDLELPTLPVVIGETGQGGPDETHPRALSLMKAQAAVATSKEFAATVSIVDTQAFYAEEPRHDGGYHFFGNAANFFAIGAGLGNAMLELVETD